MDFGDSFLPSEFNAAYLWAQLEKADEINENRLRTWKQYEESFKILQESGKVDLPKVPDGCAHNAHIFYIKCKDLEQRQRYIQFMKNNNILCAFHYVPLHSAPAGQKFGRFVGEDTFTTRESDRLVRLPIYYNMDYEDQTMVIRKTLKFFNMEGHQ